MSLNLIPLLNRPQKFSIQIKGITYQFELVWSNAELGGWTLTISKPDDTVLIAGIPLVTGIDLLAQYQHILNFSLYAATQDGSNPPFAGLGTFTQLFYAV